MGVPVSLGPTFARTGIRFRALAAVLLVLLMLLSALPRTLPAASADPDIRDNGDMTRSVLWNFTDSADYDVYNATVSGGLGELRSVTSAVGENLTSQYLLGNSTNIDLLAVPDSMLIDNGSLTVMSTTLQPGPEGFDSYLDEWFPSWTPPDGGDLTLNSMYDPGVTYNKRARVIMQFDLSAVPVGVTVVDATLSLYEKAGRTQPLEYTINAVENSWDEQGVSWRTRDANHSWTTSGGDFSSEAFSWGTVEDTIGWHDFDLTRLVDLWLRGEVPNYGFIIVPKSAIGDASKTFTDCEITNKPDQRPMLTINYTLGEAVGSYESTALGPGTNSTFTLAGWSGGNESKASDEFDGTALSPKWAWSQDPAASGGSVNFDRAGWLNVTGTQGTYLPNATAGCNFMSQNITGNFTADTTVETYFSYVGMGAGLMLMSDPLTWLALYARGVRGSQQIVAEVSKGGARTTLGSIAWSDETASLRIERSGSSYQLSASLDRVAWTMVASYEPQYDLRTAISLGPFVFSGGSALQPVAEFDYVRVLPAEQTTALDITVRTGDSTVLTDPSWRPWSAPLSPSTGASVGSPGKYVQYRVVLRTDCRWLSPTFSGLECQYERFSLNGTITTHEVTAPAFLSWESLAMTQNVSAGGIVYSYSTDHGSSWTSLGSGTSFPLTVTEPTLVIRAELSTTDTSATPSIDTIEAVYTLTHSYFYVAAPATVQAGQSFSVYIEPKDSSNGTATWTGAVTLHAVDASGTGAASSELSVTSASVPTGGQLTVSGETYGTAETIRVLVSGGGATGISDDIVVVSGPANQVVIEPNVTRLVQNTSQVFAARLCDALGNDIPGALFTWHADATLGALNATTGDSVKLTTVDSESSGFLTASSGTITASVLIVVSALLLPPQIDPDIPVQTQLEDYGSWTLDLRPYVSDREDNQTELRWYTVNETVVKITGENRTGDLVITFTTVQDMCGVNLLELWVVDSDRMKSKAIITVDITPVNDPPRIDPIDPIVVRYDEPYQYDLQFYVSDVETPDEGLIISVDAESVQYVKVANLWMTFLYPEDMNGTHQTVLLSVSDGEYTVWTVVQVSITDDYVPRTLGPMPDQVMSQGEVRRTALDLSDFFYDPDGTDLYYSNGNTHVGVVIQKNHTVDFFAPDNWAGEEFIVFAAKDDRGARAEAALRMTVVAVNHPPVIKGVPDLIVRFGEQYEFDLTPYIVDLDDDIGALSVTVVNTHAWTLGALLCMLYPSTMAGMTFPLTIAVSDGRLSDECTILVTVSNDYPPELVMAAPDHSFLEDNPIDYPVIGHLDSFFTDRDGDTLSYSAFVSVPNITAQVVPDEGNWKIIFVPETDWYGFANLTFRATDDEGALAETTVLLSVRAVPDQPTIELPEWFTATQGSRSLLEVGRNVTDPDSEQTDFRWALDCDYTDYVSIHGGIVVFDFPLEFLDSGEKSRSFVLTIWVTDQDNLVSIDTMTVTVQRNVVVTKQSPILMLGLLGSAGAATMLFAFAVVRRRKPFAVHDMMLIHNDGFLISRYAHRTAGEIDEHILSGMLTAVLNFVEDSMATSGESLKTFGFEEYQVLVSRGKKVFAAVVFDGDLPDGVDDTIKSFLETVERVYRKKLATWTGDIETDFAGVEVLIHAWVKENSHGSGKSKGALSWMRKERPKEPAAT